jgi:7-keto-8-aminopelargonate synthetase-like enzyme
LLWTRAGKIQSKIGSRKPAIPSAILPVIIGDETRTVAISAALRERDIFVPAIRYPTVARGAARLRVTVTATHTIEEINLLAAMLNEIVNRKS